MSHRDLRLNHGHSTSKSGHPWSRRCCPRLRRDLDVLKTVYGRDRTRGEIRTPADAVKIFELLKNLFRVQSRTTDVVKTWSRRGTHVIVRALAVIKTWGDAVRRESLAVYHGQSTAVTRSYHGCSAFVSRLIACVSRLITDNRIFPNTCDSIFRSFYVNS